MTNKKPNVVFLLTDDQRYGTIHALGNDVIQTPNMDRLVQNGTSFTHAHIPGGTVGAVCMPSRAMIHSGRTLFHLTDDGSVIPDNEVTMGQNFLQNGYHSCGIGKWHNGTSSYIRSFDDGAEIFFGGMWDHWNVPVNDFSREGHYDKMIPFTPDFTANSTPSMVRAQKINAGVHSTDLFTDAAVDYIRGYDSEEPFFLYLSFLAPHDPRTMPEKFKTMYKADDIPLPPNFRAMPEVNLGWSGGRDEAIEEYPRPEKAVRQHIADYYAMISHIDSRVGDVLNALDEKGMTENTIIVLCGDNGLALGQHGLMGKQNIFEHGVQVPLVMAGPGIPKGEIREQLVYLMDIYPTLCDLCEIPIPETVESVSFAPCLSNPEVSSRKDLYIAFQGRARGVIDGHYKLIEYRTEDLKLTQLFNLQADPWERYNFFGISGYEEITERLRARLLEYRDEWDDMQNKHGQVFWQAYENYENAVVKNPYQPTGKNLTKQLKLSDK